MVVRVEGEGWKGVDLGREEGRGWDVSEGRKEGNH